MPAFLSGSIIKSGRKPTEEEIVSTTSDEFTEKEYKEKVGELERGWRKEKDNFLEKLATLSLPIQDEYEILFTRYGVGGSYGLPNQIQINIDYPRARDLSSTVFHEIIHLTIEKLIKEHNIDHWTKERLVDLIFGKFFLDKQRLQRDPEKADRINEIFKKLFPDIKMIIIEISKIE